MIHLYYGEGKGKTCSAVGQVMRMVGYNTKVLFCQFIKDGSSGEVKNLMGNKSIKYICPNKFDDINSNKELFKSAQSLLFSNNYNMVVLDEGLDAMIGGAITEKELIRFIEKCNLWGTELVITGHYLPEPAILEEIDYLTHFEKKKHPYDKGVVARKGVEY